MARTHFVLRVPLFAAVVLAAASLPAWAQVRAGGRFRVNTSYQYQFAPAAAIGPGGPFAVVWVSTVDDASGNGVYGRRFTARADPAGAEFRVNDFTTSGQAQPSVAFQPDGGMVAVFTNGADAGVYARRYDFAGNPRGPEFRVNTASAATPSVAADPGGGFVVVWAGNGVLGRRYDRAGEPVGGEFQVNTAPAHSNPQPRVAVAGSGASLVVWVAGDGSSLGVRAQRYDPSGRPSGQELAVNTYTTSDQTSPGVAMDRDGNAVVVWNSWTQDGDGFGIYGQRYDASGAPRGAEFRVNAVTTDSEYFPRVASDDAGNFVVAWQRMQTPGNSGRVYARRFDAQGAPRSGDFTANEFPFLQESDAALASDRHGNFVVAWTEIPGFQIQAQRFGFLFPERLRVDPAPSSTSDGNQILEPCERVPVRTGWRNHSQAPPQTLLGTATSFTGPPGPTYLLRDATAAYGTVGFEELGLCATGGDCFEVEIPCPASRPATHWDAVMTETLSPDVQGQTAAWRLHVGESFTDMPRTSPYYLWVEALLHNGVTGGCTPTEYCGSGSTTREQMAVFLVAGRAPYYAPPACQGTPVFGDVPITSPYCRWIEELARFGITGGCGGGNYCPTANVSRQEMAVFVLRTAEPGLIPPSCATPVFADVPPDSPYCRWIEELARRGVVAGCGGGNFCPTTPVTREQMAVFIVLTFGLGIY